MKEKSPYLDLPNQMINNTCIFKENLKMITMSMIEEIWRDKTAAENIADTIKSAFFEIYKGGFDEIKELDEEQLYNSYMNSALNTERLLTENNSTMIQKNIGVKGPSPRSFSMMGIGEESEPRRWSSDLYDKDALMRLSNEVSPLVTQQANAFANINTENVFDSSNDEKQLLKSKNVRSKYQETKDMAKEEYGDQSSELIVNPYSQIQKHNPQTQSHNINIIENPHNLLDMSENRTQNSRFPSQGRNYASHDTNTNNNTSVHTTNIHSKIIKNISKGSVPKQKKPLNMKDRFYATIRDYSKQYASNSRNLSPHLVNSMKHGDSIQNLKYEFAQLNFQKPLKKFKNEIGLKSASNIHTRNRSHITQKDNFHFGESSLIRQEGTFGSHRRQATEHRSYLTNTREAINKNKPQLQ